MASTFSVSATGRSGWTTGGGVESHVKGVGRSIYRNNDPSQGTLFGGGLRGRMAPSVLTNERSDEFPRIRFTLKNAWNTTSASGSSCQKRIITPFRAVYNAGDILCRQNYACGGTCSIQSRTNLKGLGTRIGGMSTGCMADVFWSPLQVDSSIPASACNTKLVYDGSDYIKFKKHQAINRNYNDISYGSDSFSASQSVIKAIRH